jgi:hypothetical protein
MTRLIINNDLRVALRGQGIQDFDGYTSLNDDDMAYICTNIRTPVGTIANPVYNPAVADFPMKIPNPGFVRQCIQDY